MKYFKPFQWLAVAASLAMATAAVPTADAQAGRQAPKPRVISQLSVDRTEKAASGDVLTYTLTMHNQGDGAATGLVASDPIPRGTSYVPGSAETPLAKTEFTIDGGRTWSALPLQVTTDGKAWRPAQSADYSVLSGPKARSIKAGDVVEVSDGRKVRLAPASSYSHVRWLLKDSLAPGARANFSLKVKVR